jgi:hypothetical protein
MTNDNSAYTEEIMQAAWFITAKHMLRGEKDITKIVADAILQERKRLEEISSAQISR